MTMSVPGHRSAIFATKIGRSVATIRRRKVTLVAFHESAP